MLIFHSFKASGSTFSRLHQRLLKSFKEAAISLRHLEKSILEGNLYLGPLEMILRTYVMGTQKNRLSEAVLLSTQNICWNGLVRQYLQFYAQKLCLSKAMIIQRARKHLAFTTALKHGCVNGCNNVWETMLYQKIFLSLHPLNCVVG